MSTRVAVIYGGRSGEHEVSLVSAESVIAAMDPRRYEVVRYKIGKDGAWNPGPLVPEPGANAGIDVVFPVLHGTFGEDGTMQGLFELADLPYVGANVLASAVSMDKDTMKRLCRDRGLPIVEYKVVSRADVEAGTVHCEFPFPLFVKPANLGSSVGISKAHDCEELQAALKLAAQYDRKILIERGIEGREFECAVLGNDDPEASIPCEIVPSREFYDYEDKYELNQARTILPPDLPKGEIYEMRRLAVECFRAVGCEGMGRVDFLRETATARIYVNEINTVPGFTSISMFPKMWEYSGIPYAELIDRLIHLALERHAAKKATRFTR
ncbi:MAG TPA: D-alanine--D-alanine ligase family protein [Bryobacteraceae bacterium]|jgi:D-alanine-D-alanine ligase|nr:D-alanine--D-alanine ligase family protein [Bryobacteraceae bacterium]